MWRILNSMRKPGEETEGKRKPDEETKKEEEKMKKKRLFNEKWKLGQEQLVYDPGEKVMYCINCRTYGGEKNEGALFCG